MIDRHAETKQNGDSDSKIQSELRPRSLADVRSARRYICWHSHEAAEQLLSELGLKLEICGATKSQQDSSHQNKPEEKSIAREAMAHLLLDSLVFLPLDERAKRSKYIAQTLTSKDIASFKDLR